MAGAIVLVAGIAVVAGLCAFAIDYDQNLHRFHRERARSRSLVTAAVSVSFFALLGIVLLLALVR
jgi:hypothetical protein